MGGIGSGNRWRFGAKQTTRDYRAIDVRRWAREGILEPDKCFNWQWTVDGRQTGQINVRAEQGRVILSYRHQSQGQDWQSREYPVPIVTTEYNLGGARQWFLCPARGCGRRVALLYGGAIFACRQCHDLAYPSQREDASDRAARRAERIRGKLGWEPGILNGEGCRPQGMHHATFQRLTLQHDAHVSRCLAAIRKRFGFDVRM
ncbi:hypothetical protein [Nioella nitratireducens]|uniref:hypothetical protein n=1 Tax=Nioella nitratireducens TaxID=1287720 RepID=UPI0008FD551D|nr:hypothetical protein [Nioella nitratireducens]